MYPEKPACPQSPGGHFELPIHPLACGQKRAPNNEQHTPFFQETLHASPGICHHN
jgi:hypothetical protein